MVVLSHSVVLLDRLSSLMAGFILVLNHSWLCTVRSAQSSGSKLLKSPAAWARVREAIDTGEGRGGACGPVCIRCRNSSLWVFGLDKIERERRDLVDFEGLAWGGPLPLIGLA